MNRKLAFAALGLAALIYGAPAAGQISGIPSNNSDIDAIITHAKAVARQSLPACYAAQCVKLDCGVSGGIWEPMLRTYTILDAMRPPMLQIRDRLYNEALGHHYEARTTQDQIDHLRDLQLLQDSIAAVYVTASEIASSLDLVRSFRENSAEWKKLVGRGEGSVDKLPILKDIKSTIDRINAFTKYPDIGKDKPQTIDWKDLSKLAGEAFLRYAEIDRLRKSGKATSEKKRKAILSQLKDLGDLGVKLDRMARQRRIAQYADDTARYFGIADARLAVVKRINERYRKSLDAVVELRKAMNGLGVCTQRECVDPGRSGEWQLEEKLDFRPAKPAAGPEAVLRDYYGQLVTALSDFSAAVRGYTVVADYMSLLETRYRQNSYTGTIEARFALQQFRSGNERFLCIPENASLRVYRGAYSIDAEPVVVDLAEAAEVKGKKEFRVQQDLSGIWRSSKTNLELEIAVKDGVMTLTRKDTPVRGRDRVYTGNLKRRLSEPGNYTILFEDFGRAYLPSKFEVTGRVPASDDTTTLYSIPRHIDDIAPAVPEDIRTVLVSDAYRQKARYRATITPVIHADGVVQLKIALHNHKVEYLKKARTVELLKEKLWHEAEFERVDTTGAAKGKRPPWAGRQ